MEAFPPFLFLFLSGGEGGGLPCPGRQCPTAERRQGFPFTVLLLVQRGWEWRWPNENAGFAVLLEGWQTLPSM